MALRRVGKLSIRQAWGAAWSIGPGKLSAADAFAERGRTTSAYKGALAHKLCRAGRDKQGCW